MIADEEVIQVTEASGYFSFRPGRMQVVRSTSPRAASLIMIILVTRSDLASNCGGTAFVQWLARTHKNSSRPVPYFL